MVTGATNKDATFFKIEDMAIASAGPNFVASPVLLEKVDSFKVLAMSNT